MLILEIKVVPQSGRLAFVLDKSGILKCFIKSAPEKGKANEELVEFVAKTLKLPKGAVEIVSGWTNRKKIVRMQTDLSYEQFLHTIGFALQQTI